MFKGWRNRSVVPVLSTGLCRCDSCLCVHSMEKGCVVSEPYQECIALTSQLYVVNMGFTGVYIFAYI